jgi:hypothetical protein
MNKNHKKALLMFIATALLSSSNEEYIPTMDLDESVDLPTRRKVVKVKMLPKNSPVRRKVEKNRTRNKAAKQARKRN